MRFSWNFFIERHIVEVPMEAAWHLFSALDDSEMPVIYLETAEQQYLIAHGYEYRRVFKDESLMATLISKFFYRVVGEAYDTLQEDTSGYLDISLIMQDILEESWTEWRAKGYLTQDDVPPEFVS
ncbi:MAG: hypothetical protein IKY18_00325 [Oscillospiraceae bacterium]|nr:hypothetical protein [Oscillospiraceae bacterium]